MQMSPTDIRRYPRFARYVSTEMPAVADVRVIVDTILALAAEDQGPGAGATRTQVTEALQWGHGPEIRIVPGLICNGDRSDGCYTPGTNFIEIDESIVKNFELRRNHRRRTHTGRYVYHAGVTLLHELTHYIDALDGMDYPPEEGWEFENRVYGGPVL